MAGRSSPGNSRSVILAVVGQQNHLKGAAGQGRAIQLTLSGKCSKRGCDDLGFVTYRYRNDHGAGGVQRSVNERGRRVERRSVISQTYITFSNYLRKTGASKRARLLSTVPDFEEASTPESGRLCSVRRVPCHTLERSRNMSLTLLRNVRPIGEDTVDLLIDDGVIRSTERVETIPPDAEVIDGEGRLLFPGFVDAHAHMDKTLIGLGWYRNEVGPALIDKIENERKVRRERNLDSHEQSSKQARMAIATGTTHIRTFVDIDTEVKLSGFEGVRRMRDDFAQALDVQIVAFPQSGMLPRPGTIELMDEALSNGADVVGGLDPSAIDRDPAGHLDAIFNLAEKHDVDVDVHLHEPGDLGAFSVELIAERTKALGWQGRVVISHAFCLGGVEESYYQRLVELLLENRIAIMTHGPSGNRPIPPLMRLREAGVEVCSGNDGIRDSWGPLNMPDMLLRAFIVAYRNNLRRDDEIETVLDVITNGGARVLKAANYGLTEGCAADLVVVDGETHVEAVIERPARWLVMKRGRVVARNGVCLV